MTLKQLRAMTKDYPDGLAMINIAVQLGADEERGKIKRFVKGLSPHRGSYDAMCEIVTFIDGRSARTKALPGGLGKPRKVSK